MQSTRYLTAPQVLERYAITDMSLHRWLRDPDVRFPQPTMCVNGRRYWLESTLVAWERAQIPGGKKSRAARSKKPTAA